MESLNSLTQKTSIDTFKNFVLENFSESSADKYITSKLSELSQEQPKRSPESLRRLSRFINCESPIDQPAIVEVEIGTGELSIDVTESPKQFNTELKQPIIHSIKETITDKPNKEVKNDKLEKFLSKREEPTNTKEYYHTFNKHFKQVDARDVEVEEYSNKEEVTDSRVVGIHEVKQEKNPKSNAIIPTRYSTSTSKVLLALNHNRGR